ncbi:hypothetical protein Scep_016747 [Stephania cephalantha]|uniref:Uncharacterized protein n=1 Tax=Stephania cephalantha TaxID=152367 RepID=A0AAP0IN75_9MAGN
MYHFLSIPPSPPKHSSHLPFHPFPPYSPTPARFPSIAPPQLHVFPHFAPLHLHAIPSTLLVLPCSFAFISTPLVPYSSPFLSRPRHMPWPYSASIHRFHRSCTKIIKV